MNRYFDTCILIKKVGYIVYILCINSTNLWQFIEQSEDGKGEGSVYSVYCFLSHLICKSIIFYAAEQCIHCKRMYLNNSYWTYTYCRYDWVAIAFGITLSQRCDRCADLEVIWLPLARVAPCGCYYTFSINLLVVTSSQSYIRMYFKKITRLN